MRKSQIISNINEMATSVSQTTEELVKDIQEDFLTCTICIERYERPKILPCHHTFCEKCLIRDVKKSGGYFDCPTCRMPCKLPDDGIEGLENNFFMNSLLEKMQKTPTESHEIRENPIKCEICDDGDITHVCIDCQLQKFCDPCAKMHRKARISSKHTILTLEKYKEERAKNPSAVLPISYCETHKENPAKFFCDTCQVPICSECTVIEHPNRSHDYKYLNDVAAEYSAKLSTDVKILKEKVDKIDESKRAAIKILEFYNEKTKAEKAKITTKAANLIKKITAEENALKAEVTGEYAVRIKNQEIHNDDLHFRYGRLVSMINYLEFVSRHENATQLMLSEGRVTRCIRELEGLEMKPGIDHGEVEFVPAAETESLVGKLIELTNESSVADPANKGRTSSSKNDVTVGDSRKILKTESKPADSVPKLIHANFLKCRVCFDRFSNPKILPCHHTFCEKCLHSLRKKDSNRLDCPSCKESCQLTDDGVSGLPNNTYLQSLSDIMSQSANEYVVLNGICFMCNVVKATHVFIWRQIRLCCSECSKTIKRTTTQILATDESVLTINKYKKFRSADPTKVQTMSYCKIHKAYPVNLYCNTCKSPICSACTESVHPREKHAVTFIKSVSDEYGKKLIESIQKLNSQATVTKERKKEGKVLQNNFEMKCRDRVRNISRKAETAHEKAKSEEITLLENLEKKYSVQVKKTESGIDELQMKYGKLISMVNYIEMLRQHKNASELMATKRILNKKIEELLKMENTSVVQKQIIEFQLCDDGRRGDLVGVLRSDVCITQCKVDGVPQGLIKGQSVDLLVTTRDRQGKAVNPRQKVKVTLTLPDGSNKDVKVVENYDGTHTATVHGEVIGDYKVSMSLSGQAIPGSPFDFRVLIQFVKTLGKKGREDGCFDNPGGLAITKDGNLAVADWCNNRIQVIDLDGKMVRTFTFTQFENKFKPWDVAISKEGIQFMTDRANKQVVVSDVNGKFMGSFGQTELRHPNGIAIHPLNGVVYVTEWDGEAKDTDRDAHCVRKYTQEGKYINSFGGYGEKKGQFRAPYSADFDSQGNVYVSDFNNSRVQVFDKRDRFIRSFGCNGEADGQFTHPSGIVVTKDNFVYVVDEYANKIQKFDTNGRFLYRIDSKEDNLKSPRGIVEAVDDGRKVFVTDSWNHCIKVFGD